MDKVDELIVGVALEYNGRQDYYAGRNIEAEMEAIAKGEEKVVESSNKMAKAQKKAAVAGFQLGKAMKFLGGFLGIKALMGYADTWSQIGSKLSLITESDKERLAIQEKLYEIAQKTRQSMPETVDLYSKLTNNAKNLNLSEEKRLELTDLINKSLVAGGGSPEENKRVLLQFGQALGIGKFAGQDLKAIMQGNQGFAKTIAEGLGVDIGKLPEMGQKGLLTSEKVINAILSQNEKINASYLKITPTISSSLTALNNAFGKLVNNFNKTTYATNILVFTINIMTKSIETISKHVKAFIYLVFPALLLRNKLLRTALINSGLAMRYMEMRANKLSVSMHKSASGLFALGKAFLKIEAIFFLIEQVKKFFMGEDNIFILVASLFQNLENWLLDGLKNMPEKLQVGIKGALQGIYDILEDIFGSLFGWIVNFFHHGKPTDETWEERQRRQESKRQLYRSAGVNSPVPYVTPMNSNVNQNVNITVNEATQGKMAYINAMEDVLMQTNAGNGFYTPINTNLQTEMR